MGKSTLARTFAKENFEKVVEINFLKDPEAAGIFEAGPAKKIIQLLGLYANEVLVPGSTLILLAEIQECPKARTAIKFLVEDGRFAYIETESLPIPPGKAVKSYPVGFELQIHMHPLDLEEFLWVMGVSKAEISSLKKCWEEGAPVDEAVHQKMMEWFFLWMAVGGMPEIVQTFVKTGSLDKVLQSQQSILDLYRSDISKYARGLMVWKIVSILEAVPNALLCGNRRFKFSLLGGSRQFRDLEESFASLFETGIAIPCFSVKKPEDLSRWDKRCSLFKLYMNDIGLLCAALPKDVRSSVLQNNFSEREQGVLENALAQSLIAKGFDLFYSDSKKSGRLDFIVQNGFLTDILLIRPKADGRTVRVLQTEELPAGQRIIFCPSNLSGQNNILFAPFYMILFYGQKEEKKFIWNPPIPDFL